MLKNAFAISLMFGTLPFNSMQNAFAMSISITTATHSTQNQDASPSGSAAKQPQRLTVSGKLQKSMGIGGESTGWTITLDSKIDVDGKPVDSIEVQGSKKTLESLADQPVEASGVIVHKTGVERGSWPVLQIKKIEKTKASATTALEGTQWKLVEVNGKAVVSEVKAAELMLDRMHKRVAASAGCNRLIGSYKAGKDTLHFSQLAGGRMACTDPLMHQERALIEALQSTTGYRITGKTLELLKQQEVVAKFEAP